MKVVVFLTGSLGDSLVAIPALRAAREKISPGSTLALCTTGSNVSGSIGAWKVLANQGLVDEVFTYRRDGPWFGLEVVRLLRSLRRWGPDVAVFAGGVAAEPRTIRFTRLFFWLCGAQRFYGFDPEFGKKYIESRFLGVQAVSISELDGRLCRISAGQQWARCDCTKMPLFTVRPEVSGRVSEWLRKRSILPGKKYAVVGAGSNQPAKKWHAKKWKRVLAEVAIREHITFILAGSLHERQEMEAIASDKDNVLNTAGMWEIDELAALLRDSVGYVGVDSGIMHLAAAVGTRCFVLFSSHNVPGLWHPIGQGHSINTLKVPCAECHLRRCPIPSHPCMDFNEACVGNKIATFIRGCEPKN